MGAGIFGVIMGKFIDVEEAPTPSGAPVIHDDGKSGGSFIGNLIDGLSSPNLLPSTILTTNPRDDSSKAPPMPQGTGASYYSDQQLKAIKAANFSSALAVPVFAGGYTLYGVYKDIKAGINSIFDTEAVTDAATVVAVAKNPLKYVNSLIPEPLHDAYNTIDNFVNTYLPSPASKPVQAGDSSTFNSPAQTAVLNGGNTIQIAIVGGVIILSLAFLYKKGLIK